MIFIRIYRYVETSSDIFPLSRRTPVERCRQNRYRATVHPEIVCDIPVKPFPYMVNFSSSKRESMIFMNFEVFCDCLRY